MDIVPSPFFSAAASKRHFSALYGCGDCAFPLFRAIIFPGPCASRKQVPEGGARQVSDPQYPVHPQQNDSPYAYSQDPQQVPDSYVEEPTQVGSLGNRPAGNGYAAPPEYDLSPEAETGLKFLFFVLYCFEEAALKRENGVCTLVPQRNPAHTQLPASSALLCIRQFSNF